MWWRWGEREMQLQERVPDYKKSETILKKPLLPEGTMKKPSLFSEGFSFILKEFTVLLPQVSLLLLLYSAVLLHQSPYP